MLVNLTPHDVNIVVNGKIITIPPSGQVARVSTNQKVVDSVKYDGIEIPIVQTTFGEVHGIPDVCGNCHKDPKTCPVVFKDAICDEQEPKHIFIVSSLVAMALSGRKDIVAPDTSPNGVVRDSYGNIKGVKRFQRW